MEQEAKQPVGGTGTSGRPGTPSIARRAETWTTDASHAAARQLQRICEAPSPLRGIPMGHLIQIW